MVDGRRDRPRIGLSILSERSQNPRPLLQRVSLLLECRRPVPAGNETHSVRKSDHCVGVDRSGLCPNQIRLSFSNTAFSKVDTDACQSLGCRPDRHRLETSRTGLRTCLRIATVRCLLLWDQSLSNIQPIAPRKLDPWPKCSRLFAGSEPTHDQNERSLMPHTEASDRFRVAKIIGSDLLNQPLISR